MAQTIPPLATFYRKKRHSPQWWWLVAVAYGLFLALFVIVQPTHINAVLSLWAIPLIVVGLIRWLFTDDKIDNFNYLRWLYLKYFGDSAFQYLLSHMTIIQILKNIFLTLNTTNKIGFSYLIFSFLTVFISVHYKFTEEIVFTDNYVFLILKLIFCVYFLFDLSAIISNKIRQALKKWQLKQIIKRHYPTFDNHIYSDKQLLAWVKQSRIHYYQNNNQNLPDNEVFAIGKKANQIYFRGMHLYKVDGGKITLIKQFNHPTESGEPSVWEMETLENFKDSHFFVDKKIIEKLFSELKYDYEKASLLQWQIFLTSKLPTWIKIL